MSNSETNDVVLIGAGIMSATLGTLLKELAPDWKMKVYEKLDKPGEESSNEWNNAGTGHSALCELNYTPEKADGAIDTKKAVKINEQFQVSKQFWSYLVKNKRLQDPREFIRPLPHMSFVQGEKNVTYLKKRYEALKNHPLFEGMEFTDDSEKLKEWVPLMMEGRTSHEPIAATKIDSGTDVNFGALTRLLFEHLIEQNVQINYRHHVKDVKRTNNGLWELKVKDLRTGSIKHVKSKFVFIGAGGGSLHLLQKSGIREGKHIGGFPVSGLFLVCNNPKVVERHHAKVYSKAKIGAPPMSVPHLDTRFIDGKKSLLFGPFAGFTPKFLKNGSNWDLFASVKPHNLMTLLASAFKNFPLEKYLIQQLMLTKEKRIDELREFVPTAKSEDWEIVIAGQRVQIIKDTETGGKGMIQFGTEVVTSKDGSIAALLGASPGASTAVHVMLEVIKKSFPEQLIEWEPKIKEMIPSYGIFHEENPDLYRELQFSIAETLGLSEQSSLTYDGKEPMYN
ncbi:malate:quinone oxidoreductase [Fervidibacillus albus]|uniref:Probable malate:quinone oxidoreductase n=1 Tax=Fervidibacillus albus TaxID=2980026 RepID=A0A9E8LWR6_9BACI|nr:malate:quinone oxidoreductase [Fervidibacillus albus]WAA11143.1 malate:quinone oxidoreductase [Fervidibacillus albus]